MKARVIYVATLIACLAATVVERGMSDGSGL
jgi:hypothetical protein